MWEYIIPAAINIGLGFMSNRANARAVMRQIEAEERANEIQTAKDDIAKARLETQRSETAAGLANIRATAANDPGVMTPAQEQAIAEGRKDTLTAISPGMRGSGRAVTAAIRGVEENTRNRFIDANRARQDRASTQLFSAGNTALRDINAIDTGARTNLAASQRRQGDIRGGADIAEANIGRDVVTGLGRITADYLERQKKQDEQVAPSRYGTKLKAGDIT